MRKRVVRVEKNRNGLRISPVAVGPTLLTMVLRTYVIGIGFNTMKVKHSGYEAARHYEPGFVRTN